MWLQVLLGVTDISLFDEQRLSEVLWTYTYFLPPTVPPVVVAPENYTVVEGSNAVIIFDYLGRPPPYVLNYFFNDVKLEVDQSGTNSESGRVVLQANQNGSLLIKDVRRSDAGVYSIFARNVFGENSGSTRLIVLRKFRMERDREQTKYFYTKISNTKYLWTKY